MAIYQKIKIPVEFEKLPLKKMFVVSIFIGLITLVVSLGSIIILPPVIPLLYGLPQNDEQLVPNILIIVPSLVTIIFSFVNIFISLNSESNYLKKILAFSSILVCILTVITTFKIIFLVGSI
jgi:O-antigen/teichoic acid export membrane protein